MDVCFTKSCGIELTLGCNLDFQKYPVCRARRALSSDTQFLEIRHCNEDLHSCSVFSKCSAPIMTTCHSLARLEYHTEEDLCTHSTSAGDCTGRGEPQLESLRESGRHSNPVPKNGTRLHNWLASSFQSGGTCMDYILCNCPDIGIG